MTNGPDPITVDEDEIRRLYHDKGLSKKKVGEKLGVSEMTIVRRMKKYNIPTRDQPQAVANDYAGYYQTSNGYMIAADSVGGKRKSIRIHQLLAISEYGFDTVVNNEIHHKNGVKWDNRPSNIEPLSSKEHRQKHFCGKTNEER